MLKYLIRRLIASAVMLVIVSLLIFLVLRVLPGDPTISRFGQVDGVTPEALAAMRETLGLDKPVLIQYVDWVAGMLHGDFGFSYFSGYPVSTLIGQRIMPTLQLALGGLIVAVVIALIFGVLPVVLRKRAVTVLIDAYTVYGLSAPVFVTAIIFIMIFSMTLAWLPATGYVDLAADFIVGLQHLVIPSLSLGIAISAPLIRYLQSSIDEALKSTYVRTAQGKGIGWFATVRGSVLPNALLPALTSLGISVGSLLGGVVVVETVFAWPGMGQQVVDAVMKRDYAVIQATVLLAAAAFIVTTLLVDILYGVLDPRLRIAKTRSVARKEAMA